MKEPAQPEAEVTLKTIVNEDAELLWWNRWWKEDYSWEGLKKHKPWLGWKRHPDESVREFKPAESAPGNWKDATLQDYWRNIGIKDADLIEFGGKKFTAFHLPLADQYGNPSEKASWNGAKKEDFENRIAELLLVSGETRGQYRKPEGADYRAQLDGVIAPFFPSPDKIRDVNKEKKEFTIDNFKKNVTGKFILNLSARNGYLVLGAWWKGADIGPMADFAGAAFIGDVDFSNTEFRHTIYFPSAVYSGYVNFSGSIFKIGAQFADAVFASGSSFANTKFEHDGSFRSARFLRTANFCEIDFSANAYFDRAVFFGDAVFRETSFGGLAVFSAAKFQSNSEHFNTIVFNGAKFKRYSTFEGATFSGDTSFHEVQFLANSNLATLLAENIRMLQFTSSKFLAPTKFSVCGRSYPRHLWDRCFLDVQLPSLLDAVSKHVFSEFSAFDGAETKGRIDFSASTLRDDAGFKIALQRARGVSQPNSLIYFDRRFRGNSRERWLRVLERLRRISRSASVIEKRDARLKALEGGCRVIKQSNEGLRDRLLEQRFYVYELIARRSNTQTPRWEKTLSYLFDWTSAYGASVSRPFMWLVRVWFAYALFFWVLAGIANGRIGDLLTYQRGDSIDPSVGEALTLSGEMMFRPFFVWATRNEAIGTVGHTLLVEQVAYLGLLTRLIGTVESFMAASLLFLIALAIRRRFQLS